jgi:hypothetical protein
MRARITLVLDVDYESDDNVDTVAQAIVDSLGVGAEDQTPIAYLPDMTEIFVVGAHQGG